MGVINLLLLLLAIVSAVAAIRVGGQKLDAARASILADSSE